MRQARACHHASHAPCLLPSGKCPTCVAWTCHGAAMVSTTPRRDQHGEAYLPNTALSTHDMAQLALCCTGLESLTVVVDTVHHDNGEGGDIDRREQPCSLLPLQQLSCLTALGLQQAGAGLGQTTGWLHSHLLELSGCTGLQSLVLCGRSCLITDSSVQALTQLTALTQLHMDISPDAPVSDTVAPGKGSSERQLSLCLFDCLWDDAVRVPVWQQLAARCAQSMPTPQQDPCDGAGNSASDEPLGGDEDFVQE